jgi:hypothetical protein
LLLLEGSAFLWLQLSKQQQQPAHTLATVAWYLLVGQCVPLAAVLLREVNTCMCTIQSSGWRLMLLTTCTRLRSADRASPLSHDNVIVSSGLTCALKVTQQFACNVRLTFGMAADTAPLALHSAPSAAAGHSGALGRHNRDVQPSWQCSTAAAARLEAALAGARCCVRCRCSAAGGGCVADGCTSLSMTMSVKGCRSLFVVKAWMSRAQPVTCDMSDLSLAQRTPDVSSWLTACTHKCCGQNDSFVQA